MPKFPKKDETPQPEKTHPAFVKADPFKKKTKIITEDEPKASQFQKQRSLSEYLGSSQGPEEKRRAEKKNKEFKA